MVAPVKNGSAYRIHGGGGGRQYGFMLLLAVGAAILGFTVLHKLREGRIFSLLVKEKDHELLSLHLLLQREQEFSKEVRTKLEEMKSNMYSVKAQKSDVEGRLLEVESLVSSLKDEQKILESQLEEKRNEIKMLSQQKQMAIDDPNSHSEEPSSVWSGISQGSNNDTQAVDDKPDEQSREPKQSENGNGTMIGSNGLEGDGSGSGIRVKSSKQRRLRGRKWRNLIKRFREQKDNNTRGLEQMSQNRDGHVVYKLKDDSSSEHDLSLSLSNQDGASMGNKGQDEHVTLRKEGLLSMDKNVTYSSLDPELDPDSRAGKILDAEPDSDSSARRILDSEPDPDSSDGKVMGSEPDPDSSLEKVLGSEPDPDSSVGKGLNYEPDPDSSLEKGLGDQDSSIGKVLSLEPSLDSSAGKVLSSEPILDSSVVKLQGSEPYPDSSAGNGPSYESDPDSSDGKVQGSEPDPDSITGKGLRFVPHSDSSTEKVLDSEPDPDSSSGIVLDSEPDPDSSSRDALDSEPDPDSSSGKVVAEDIAEEETKSNKDDELSNKTDESVDDML